jgi:hypothetical protein
VVVTDGLDPVRSRSTPACATKTISFPTVKAEDPGSAFDVAGAITPPFANEVVVGATYAINGACFRDPDIESNNGWWYRNAGTQHWMAATLFADFTNGFHAPRVSGGTGSNCD